MTRFVFQVLLAFVFVSFLVVLVEAYADESREAIVNGKVASPGQFPYIAYLVITPVLLIDRIQCGGTLISKEYVLTAAHCVSDFQSADVHLGVQNHKNQSDPERKKYTSTTAILHERYDVSSIINDLALLKLSAAVKLTNRIQLVSLPSSDDLFEGRKVFAVGWGRNSRNNEGGTDELMNAEMTVISNGDCKRSLSNISPSKLCAQGRRKENTCKGDSGGPIVLKNTTIIVGVVSYGKRNCDLGYPQVNTRVSSYVAWIKEKTGI